MCVCVCVCARARACVCVCDLCKINKHVANPIDCFQIVIGIDSKI